MASQTVQNVPRANVGKVVQAFVNNGASKVVAARQNDGLWTVTATGLPQQ